MHAMGWKIKEQKPDKVIYLSAEIHVSICRALRYKDTAFTRSIDVLIDECKENNTGRIYFFFNKINK